jgi:type II secretory ATPase GspE/PulE/Tfp pilus assembly ATPase PilB-like protein
MTYNSTHAAVIERLQEVVQHYDSMESAFNHIEQIILEAFRSQRMSIFQRRSHHKDLVSRYKTGNEILEIKVPINTQSIAGYVAMTNEAIIVNNPYSQQVLSQINVSLTFESKYDELLHLRTDNLLCAPISYENEVLGVIEVVNKELEGFEDDDKILALAIAEVIGKAFRYELGGTAKPFDYLAHTGRVSPTILSQISKGSSINEGVEQLKDQHQISERLIYDALSIYFQVPFVGYSPRRYKLDQSNTKLSASYLKRNHVVILRDSLDNLMVAMYEPNNFALLSEIENALCRKNYQLALSMPHQILRYLKDADPQAEPLESKESIKKKLQLKNADVSANGDDPDTESGITLLVTNILADAYRLSASDIHIDAEIQGPTLVRMRVDGVVRDIQEIPVSQHNAVIARIKVMSDLNIAEKRLPQDGKLSFTASNEVIEVRVATIPTVAGEGMVLRILAGNDAIPIEKLNLAKHNIERIREMVLNPNGVILVVGPTGSGKTTTLHAILGVLNTPDKKIWTAEDPVEITQYRLQQVQVNPRIGFTFARALRAFLRADPDVILIGEMRDKETANAGIEASLTGHLVLSTLHTNSASETITRLLDLGIDPVNFSDACVGILAQRLIRTLCTSCKEEYKPSEVEIDFIRRQYNEEYVDELKLTPLTRLYRTKGCPQCDRTGYKGRTGVHELLSMTPELRGLIYKGSSIPEMKKQAMRDGMRTLVQDTILKVINGEVDMAQVQIISGMTVQN